MSPDPVSVALLWHQLGWPLIRLMLFISIGLLAANLIEMLNWSRKISVLARPLIDFSRLSERTGAAFSMAFISGVTANSMLAESFSQKKISKKELGLTNLFNSLPATFCTCPPLFLLSCRVLVKHFHRLIPDTERYGKISIFPAGLTQTVVQCEPLLPKISFK